MPADAAFSIVLILQAADIDSDSPISSVLSHGRVLSYNPYPNTRGTGAPSCAMDPSVSGQNPALLCRLIFREA
jgi:hypothetical protein